MDTEKLPEILRGSLQHEIVLLLKSSFGRFIRETQQRLADMGRRDRYALLEGSCRQITSESSTSLSSV